MTAEPRKSAIVCHGSALHVRGPGHSYATYGQQAHPVAYPPLIGGITATSSPCDSLQGDPLSTYSWLTARTQAAWISCSLGHLCKSPGQMASLVAPGIPDLLCICQEKHWCGRRSEKVGHLQQGQGCQHWCQQSLVHERRTARSLSCLRALLTQQVQARHCLPLHVRYIDQAGELLLSWHSLEAGTWGSQQGFRARTTLRDRRYRAIITRCVDAALHRTAAEPSGQGTSAQHQSMVQILVHIRPADRWNKKHFELLDCDCHTQITEIKKQVLLSSVADGGRMLMAG